MMTFSQMIINFVVALALGALMGLERELVGKEAGIRTSMLVAGGAALFAMVGLALPYINTIAGSPESLNRSIGAMNAIGNIVIGIGFLGAGMIFKDQTRVHGLTTAAAIWATAAIGTLVGLGLLKFAASATLIVIILLYILRKVSVYDKIKPTDQPGSK